MNEAAGKELYEALTKAQASFQSAIKERSGQYKYADYGDIIEVSRPYLVAQGLSVMQPFFTDVEGKWWLVTQLSHTSGQYIEYRCGLIPPIDFDGTAFDRNKNIFQSFGSQLTYMRRYCYAAMLGVVTDDDDGAAAAHVKRPQQQREEPKPSNYINQAEVDMLMRELAGYPEIGADILEEFNIETFAQHPKAQFAATMMRIREIKSKMEPYKKERS